MAQKLGETLLPGLGDTAVRPKEKKTPLTKLEPSLNVEGLDETGEEVADEPPENLTELVRWLAVRQLTSDHQRERDLQIQEARWADTMRALQGRIGSPDKGKSTGLKDIKLSKLAAEDDIEAYLTTFEKVASACRWPHDQWVIRLAPYLTGRAQMAYSHMNIRDAEQYDLVKREILRRYDISNETYRQRFHAIKYQPNNLPRELYAHLKELFVKWIRPEGKTVAQMIELLVIEQFIHILPHDIQIWTETWRSRNERKWPDRLAALDSMLNHSSTFLKGARMIPDDDQIFTEVELSTMEKVINETVAWKNETVAEQKKLSPADKPVLLSKDIESKLAALDREVKYLLNKAKFAKPKPKKDKEKNTTKTEAGKNATDSEKVIPPKDKTTEEKPEEVKPVEEPPKDVNAGKDDSSNSQSEPLELEGLKDTASKKKTEQEKKSKDCCATKNRESIPPIQFTPKCHLPLLSPYGTRQRGPTVAGPSSPPETGSNPATHHLAHL
nr:PREDICTED: hypoxia up-regulated protein 1-like [Latimeria chalumnae]|eukprot:XP_006001909.1 PREDICTED: hypoxia up-regulated protein 1-like [Latimeria chalumnae]